MDNLKEKIQAHFSKPEIIKNLNDFALQNFPQENIRKNFLDIFEATKNGDFNCNDLLDYFYDWLDVEMEQAIILDDQLFDQVYGDVYKELQQLYEEKRKQRISESKILESATDQTQQNDLTQKYNAFTLSSLFQNILAAEEFFRNKYLVNGNLDANGLKEEFYGALNGSDKIKFIGTLRVLAAQGVLGASFKDDKRYLDFWGSFLQRHYGEATKNSFLVKPIDKKYFVEFLRFVLEKRLNFNTEESAMIGTGLAALCAAANETDLSEIAYGDESKNRFVWNE